MNYLDTEDTIIATASGSGASSVDIIRISGGGAFDLYESITGEKQRTIKSNEIKKYDIYSPNTKKLMDSCLVATFKNPNTYTGENVVEINCHGGGYIANSIINEIVNSKMARLALPGEFTFRAYMNNKVDLIEAEAINDIVSCKTSIYFNKSLENLGGRLSIVTNKIKNKIINLLKVIEHELDFNEDEIIHLTNKNILRELSLIHSKINIILKSYHMSKIIRGGFRVILLGSPNVGKSSIYNSLLGYNRSIIANQPGTTRDTIESCVEINGHNVTIIDTAGYWESGDEIEKMGVDKTKKEIEKCDIIILVAENSASFNEFKNIIKGKSVIKVLSKNDILKHFGNYLSVSSVIDGGCDKLLTRISTTIVELYNNGVVENPYFINERHKNILHECVNIINRTKKFVNGDLSADIVADSIHNLLDTYNNLITPVNRDDIINDIFSNFCIGK